MLAIQLRIYCIKRIKNFLRETSGQLNSMSNLSIRFLPFFELEANFFTNYERFRTNNYID